MEVKKKKKRMQCPTAVARICPWTIACVGRIDWTVSSVYTRLYAARVLRCVRSCCCCCCCCFCIASVCLSVYHDGRSECSVKERSNALDTRIHTLTRIRLPEFAMCYKSAVCVCVCVCVCAPGFLADADALADAHACTFKNVSERRQSFQTQARERE